MTTEDKDFDTQYRNAVEAGNNESRALSVHFDRVSKRLQIELQDGVAMMIPVASIQGLEKAKAREIETVELLAQGYALHWPALNVDVTVPGLMAGIFGTKQWMREIASGFLSDAGRKGGSTSTKAKRAAARTNGKLGGRPRKKVIA